MTSTFPTLAVTLAIQALVSMALITLPVMGPAVAAHLGVAPALIGLYVALVYGAAMMASLAAGTAVARFGALRVSQVSLLLCAVGLAMSTAASLPAIALGAVLIGLGYGPVTPASSHLLARSTPPHRLSLVFSLKQTGVPLGGVLAGAIVPPLLVLGWQRALCVVALANVACALLAQPLRRSLDADRQPQRPLVLGSLAQPIRLVMAHPALRRLAACSFVFSIAQLSLTTYLVTYLHETLGYGLVAAGLLLSVSQGAGVGGRILWGYVSDRWLGARRTLTGLAVLMALSSAVTALLQATLPMPLMVLPLIVFGASAIGWNGVYLAEVAREAPAGQAGVATGGTLAVTFFGVVVGPPLFGVIANGLGSYRAGFAAVAVCVTLCVFVLVRGLMPARAARAT